jgi:hypothetical protein
MGLPKLKKTYNIPMPIRRSRTTVQIRRVSKAREIALILGFHEGYPKEKNDTSGFKL